MIHIIIALLVLNIRDLVNIRTQGGRIPGIMKGHRYPTTPLISV